MTDQTMIERMAEAAKQALLNDPESSAWMNPDYAPESFKIDGEINLVLVARAVLTAMREPTEVMVEKGENAIWAVPYAGQGSFAGDDAARNSFTAMIDAALAEEG
jgi:hypothetical protein